MFRLHMSDTTPCIASYDRQKYHTIEFKRWAFTYNYLRIRILNEIFGDADRGNPLNVSHAVIILSDHCDR